MKRLFFISLGLIVFSTSVCFSEPSVETKKKMMKEIVKIVDGKMVFERFSLITMGKDSVQIKTRSEAPAEGVISRDNFVAMTVMLQTFFFQKLSEKSGGKHKTKTLDELIGEPNLEIDFVMAKNGIQIKTKDYSTGKVSLDTATWEKIMNGE